MSHNQYQSQNQYQNEEAAIANYNRVMAQMDAMDERLAEWHADEDIRDLFHGRLAMINNTEGYYTGDRVLHCRTIQMCTPEDWFALFGRDQSAYPYSYTDRCMNYSQDETGLVPYPGELEVSLLLEENVTPGIHRAVFIVYVSPHEQFHDGHIIEMEYGEGSNRQQSINRIFARSIVQEFTEYQLLAFLADDHEMNSLLYGYFLDGFNPMRFGDAQDEEDVLRRRHECCNIVNVVLHDGDDLNANADDPPAVAIPPPPPVNDFAAIYRENFGDADNDHDEYADNDDYDIWGDIAAAAAHAQNNHIEYNIIQNDDGDGNVDVPARG